MWAEDPQGEPMGSRVHGSPLGEGHRFPALSVLDPPLRAHSLTSTRPSRQEAWSRHLESLLALGTLQP